MYWPATRRRSKCSYRQLSSQRTKSGVSKNVCATSATLSKRSWSARTSTWTKLRAKSNCMRPIFVEYRFGNLHWLPNCPMALFSDRIFISVGDLPWYGSAVAPKTFDIGTLPSCKGSQFLRLDALTFVIVAVSVSKSRNGSADSKNRLLNVEI